MSNIQSTTHANFWRAAYSTPLHYLTHQHNTTHIFIAAVQYTIQPNLVPSFSVVTNSSCHEQSRTEHYYKPKPHFSSFFTYFHFDGWHQLCTFSLHTQHATPFFTNNFHHLLFSTILETFWNQQRASFLSFYYILTSFWAVFLTFWIWTTTTQKSWCQQNFFVHYTFKYLLFFSNNINKSLLSLITPYYVKSF